MRVNPEMVFHVGGGFVPFVRSPNSSIELPGVKAPVRSHIGELLVPVVSALIPVRPIGFAVLLFDSLIT
jgi:hypothetical protein